MNIVSKFKRNVSDTTRAVALAGVLVLVGTALVTTWTAAIAPQHDPAVYAATVQMNAIGSLLGFTLAAAGGFLAGCGHAPYKTRVIDPARRRHK